MARRQLGTRLKLIYQFHSHNELDIDLLQSAVCLGCEEAWKESSRAYGREPSSGAKPEVFGSTSYSSMKSTSNQFGQSRTDLIYIRKNFTRLRNKFIFYRNACIMFFNINFNYHKWVQA